MTLFYQLSALHQAVLLTSMYLVTLLSIFCIGLSRYVKRGIVHILIDAALLIILFAFTAQFFEVKGLAYPEAGVTGLLNVPVWALWSITICSAIWLVFEAAGSIHRMKNTISRRSVKDALDTLPSAVCYFTPQGTVKLCNLQMHRMFGTLAHSDLQTLSELRQALADCGENSEVKRLSDERQIYLFPDQRAWQFTSTEVTADNGVTYTEALFCDVTELCEKQRELCRRNAELKEMYREIKKLSEDVLEMTREHEILTAKTVLHDRMGAGVVAIRQSLQQHNTSEENAAAIELLYNAVQVIKNDNDSPVGRGEAEEFLHDASVVGIRAEITGEMPEVENVSRLFLLAMKESLANAVRHADASALRIDIGKTDTAFSLRITNDGKPPQGEITPRGGLLNLSRHLAQYGGRMEISREPCFMLTVTVPTDGGRKKEVF